MLVRLGVAYITMCCNDEELLQKKHMKVIKEMIPRSDQFQLQQEAEIFSIRGFAEFHLVTQPLSMLKKRLVQIGAKTTPKQNCSQVVQRTST